MPINLRPENSPDVQRMLAVALRRPQRDLSQRELKVELASGGLFLAAALALAFVDTGSRAVDPGDALVVFVGLLLAARVAFEVGSCYTVPVQVVFVPALFVLPPASVPLFVAAAFVAGGMLDVIQGERRPSRVINALGDSWFAFGPALVLALDGSPSATDVAPIVLLVALASQFAIDATTSMARERLHGDAGIREQLAESGWVYLVDILLSPIGFALALAATIEPAAVALSWPLFILLAIFAREREERLESLLELGEAYRGTARVLGEVVEHDDAYTAFHIRGVAELAVEVAADLGLDPRQRRLVEFGALLHDVGKIAIPDEIIKKPGPLDDVEWQVIKTHTIEGQRMLDAIGGLMADVGRIVRWSHERWDGAGYPDGLAGEEIPIESRVVFCCDAFNAMTTDRSYRTALSIEVALDELDRGSGSQFDPQVVRSVKRQVTEQQAKLRAQERESLPSARR